MIIKKMSEVLTKSTPSCDVPDEVYCAGIMPVSAINLANVLEKISGFFSNETKIYILVQTEEGPVLKRVIKMNNVLSVRDIDPMVHPDRFGTLVAGFEIKRDYSRLLGEKAIDMEE